MTALPATIASLARYRAHHRDRRNVMTHALGIPMIVFGIEILLSRPLWMVPGFTLTPAVVVTVFAAFHYLGRDKLIGGMLALVLIAMARAGMAIGQQATSIWLGLGLGLFVGGWALQLLGHHFEGRKPAFLDDLRSLLVGPLFVAAEAAFALGLRLELKAEIERA